MFCVLIMFLSLLGVATPMPGSSCKVDSFSVQEDFDFIKFLGRWYLWEVAIPTGETLYENHQINFVQDGTGAADVFQRRRGPNKQCLYPKGKLRQPLSGADTAKLQYQPEGLSLVFDYWVISTDYNNHAVVYRCATKATNGRCSRPYSSIFVRSALDGLSQANSLLVNTSLAEVCLERQEFVAVPRTKPECRQCDRPTWTVQPAFDLQQYLGVWFEIVFKPRVIFSREFAFSNYFHDYSLLPNGTIIVSVTGRDPANDQCFVSPSATSIRTTATAGKMIFIEPSATVGDDYWVIETDYTGYAFVLGCVRESTTPDGQCETFRSWVWSRKPYLNSFQFIRFTKLFDQYCINEDEYFITTHDNPCV